jgi:recombination protein RecT
MNDLITLIDAQRDTFEKVVSDKAIEFEREKGFAVQIITANDYLLKVAMQNKESLKNAVTNVAAIGISLNPASKLAYLVPRKIKGVMSICLDISYMGLMDVAQRAGAIQWGQAKLVRKTDTFRLNGLDKTPTHEYSPFDTERGDVVGVYCVVKTDGGDYLTHAMTIAEVHAIRDRSESWKAYKADNTKKCPWVTDEGEMVKKTCVKQGSKYWPRRERLDTAVHHLNTDGGEGITLKPNKMPDEEFEGFKKAILETDTKDAAKKKWQEAVVICKDLGDVDSAERLKTVMLRHAIVLDGGDPDAPAVEKKAA